MQKKNRPCSFSAAMQTVEPKPKARFTTKLYFWLFIILMIFAAFAFWTGRKGEGMTLNITAGIITACLSIFFAIISFIRFIRSRSIVGGLFLTTCVSTGVFLGASQLLPIIVPPTAAAFSSSPETTNNGLQLIVALAQVGLFAIWFLFLLFTIYLHVHPVKKIDRYLQKIVDGDEITKVRIGKARQYRSIEEKIKAIASGHTPRAATDSGQEAAET